MKEKINIGYIGLGRRGRGMLKACFSQMNDVNVKTICDISEERIEMGKQLVLEKGGYTPASTTNYQDILNDPEIDAVVIMTGWNGIYAHTLLRVSCFTGATGKCVRLKEVILALSGLRGRKADGT